jgi:hypothetical protein
MVCGTIRCGLPGCCGSASRTTLGRSVVHLRTGGRGKIVSLGTDSPRGMAFAGALILRARRLRREHHNAAGVAFSAGLCDVLAVKCRLLSERAARVLACEAAGEI